MDLQVRAPFLKGIEHRSVFHTVVFVHGSVGLVFDGISRFQDAL